MVIIKGIKFCHRGKSFKVLSMIIYLFSLIEMIWLASKISFFEMILFVLAGIVELICWSGRVNLNFSFHSLNCISGLVLLCFFTSSNKKMIRFTLFCRFFNILRDISLTSLGSFFSSLILLKVILNMSCSAKQFKMSRVSIKNRSQK